MSRSTRVLIFFYTRHVRQLDLLIAGSVQWKPNYCYFFFLAKMDVDTSEDFTLFIGGTCIGIILATFPFYSKRWSVLLRKITNFNVFGKPPGTEKTINFHYYVTILFRLLSFLSLL